jgi:hypothetical protein
VGVDIHVQAACCRRTQAHARRRFEHHRAAHRCAGASGMQCAENDSLSLVILTHCVVEATSVTVCAPLWQQAATQATRARQCLTQATRVVFNISLTARRCNCTRPRSGPASHAIFSSATCACGAAASAALRVASFARAQLAFAFAASAGGPSLSIAAVSHATAASCARARERGAAGRVRSGVRVSSCVTTSDVGSWRHWGVWHAVCHAGCRAGLREWRASVRPTLSSAVPSLAKPSPHSGARVVACSASGSASSARPCRPMHSDRRLYRMWSVDVCCAAAARTHAAHASKRGASVRAAAPRACVC